MHPMRPSDQLVSVLDAKGIEEVILVGNSAGGTLALRTALAHPDRVDGLILVSPAVYTGGGAPQALQPFLGLPSARSPGTAGVASVRRAWRFAGRTVLFRSLSDHAEQAEKAASPCVLQDWDTSLWEFTKASQESDLVSNGWTRLSCRCSWSPATVTALCRRKRAFVGRGSTECRASWSRNSVVTSPRQSVLSHSWPP